MRHEKLFQTALDPLSIETGNQVGSYMLIDELGRGGSGIVWLAVQAHLGREVALKVLRDAGPSTDWGGSARRQARFHREVEVASLLDHPNIAHVYDSGFTDGVPYLVMEYVDGQSLDDYVREAKLTTEEIIILIKTIAEGVQHAHQRGVIHRDLKPSNILVTPEGRPAIVDFGLAKALDSGDIGAAGADVSLDGELVGTPAYMAPEQARGESNALDTRVDVYALGVILYQLLTERLPHDVEGTSIEVLRRISETDIYRPSLAHPNLAGDLEALLLKALAKDPEDRYASAGELAEDLDRYLQHQPLQARPANTLYFLSKHLIRHWAVWLAVALGLILVSAAITRYVYDTKAFALTEKELRSTLAVEASAAEFRNAEAEDEVDVTLTTLATSLEQNPNNLPSATLAGMLLKQTASLIPLSALPPHHTKAPQQYRFADTAPTYAAYEGREVLVCSEDSPKLLSQNLTHSSPVTHVEIAANGKALVSLQQSGVLSVWSQHNNWQTPTITDTAFGRSLQISPDGNWVAWISEDDNVFTWNWQSEEPKGLSPSDQQAITLKKVMEQPSDKILFDPKSRYLLVKKGEFQAMLWNLQARSLCLVTHDKSSGANPPAPLTYTFSPDGQRFMGMQPGKPQLFHYELPSKAIESFTTITSTPIDNSQGFSTAAFHPDKEQLLVFGAEQVAMADLETGALTEMTPEGLYWPRTMTMSGNGQLIAVTGTQASVCLIDSLTGKTVRTLQHSWGVQKLALNDSGTLLALVDGRGKLSLWDSQSGRILGNIDANLREMAHGQSLRFSLNGNHIVATTADNHTKAYRFLEASIRPRVLRTNKPFLAFALSPDTSKVITSTAKKALLWDTLMGKPLVGPLDHLSAFADAPIYVDFRFRREPRFEPSGEAFYLRKTYKSPQRYLLDGTPSGPGILLRHAHGTLQATPSDPLVVSSVTAWDITIWDPATGSIRWERKPGGHLVWASLSSHGNFLLAGSTVRRVTVWDMASGDQVHQMIPHHGWLSDVVWSPDDSLLATASKTAEVKLFSTETWEELATFGHQAELTKVDFHPHKPMLLSAALDGTATLWDIETFSSYGRSMNHESPVLFASFSRDGDQLVTACQDGTVRLWDTHTQEPLCQSIRHPAAVTKVEFTADSKHLVTLCEDGKVRVWPIFIANEPAPSWFPGLLRGVSGSQEDLIQWNKTALEGNPYLELSQQCIPDLVRP